MESQETPNGHSEDEPADVEGAGFVGYLDRRPELGLWRMLVNCACERGNVFKPKERRKARKALAVFVLTVLGLAAWFAWFNLIR